MVGLKRAKLLEEHQLADESRVRKGMMTATEAGLRRLEADEPGITKVNWGADGSVLLDDD